MKKQKFLGNKCIILSSLALLVLSLWEVSVRLDAMYKPIKMFFDMAAGEGIPLSVAMTYFDVGIFEAPLWLLACMLAALMTIFFVRRPSGATVTLPLSVLLAVYGLMRETSFFTDLWRLIQPGLLLFNAFVIVLNLTVYPLRRRAAEKKDKRPPEHTSPRLQDAPRLRSISRKEQEASGDQTRRSA